MSSALAYVAFLIALGLAGFAAWLQEQPAPQKSDYATCIQLQTSQQPDFVDRYQKLVNALRTCGVFRD
jgi:lipopolysaccharide export LptBFGC system permease protein LptF